MKGKDFKLFWFWSVKFFAASQRNIWKFKNYHECVDWSINVKIQNLFSQNQYFLCYGNQLSPHKWIYGPQFTIGQLPSPHLTSLQFLFQSSNASCSSFVSPSLFLFVILYQHFFSAGKRNENATSIPCAYFHF